MNRVLITGGGGFLGRHFVDWFAHKGWAVDTVDDLSSLGSEEPSMGTFFHMTFQDWLATEEVADEQYDLVIHLAAPVGGRIKIEQDPLYNAGSLELDSLMFRWAIKHTRKLVYPSSSAVYGTSLQATGNARPLAEHMLNLTAGYALPMPDEMYGFTKLAGEVLAWKAAAYGLSTLCIRPFSGYGEGQSFDYPLPSIAARVAARQDPLVVWGTGQQERDLIHVEDLVELTVKAVGAMAPDTYWPLNLGSGVGTSMKEIAQMLAEIEGYDPLIVFDTRKPEGVMRRIADIDQMRVIGLPGIGRIDGLTRVLNDVKTRVP